MKPDHFSPIGTPIPERIRRMSTEGVGGCWEWLARVLPNGYGVLSLCRGGVARTAYAHRVSYEAFVGPIPPGMTVDHICFKTACVNPDHLRLLTRRENAANQRKAHSSRCRKGHEYTPENTWWRNGKRHCRTCRRTRDRARYAEKRAAA